MITVRWGSAKRWSSDLAGLLLDWHCEDDATLVLALDYAALRKAHKDISVTTATWALEGTYYQTTMVGVVPAGNVVYVTAREAGSDG